MEIERKFLIKFKPENLADYDFCLIEQGYLCREPVIRIRKENDNYYMTYKGKGCMVREEYNLPLNKDAYESLLPKCEGRIISKKRVLIPYGKYTIELDLFARDLAPLIIAEVEFESEAEANAFTPPEWFSTDVSDNPQYQNSNLSK